MQVRSKAAEHRRISCLCEDYNCQNDAAQQVHQGGGESLIKRKSQGSAVQSFGLEAHVLQPWEDSMRDICKAAICAQEPVFCGQYLIPQFRR